MSVMIVGGGMTGATLALAISHLTQGSFRCIWLKPSRRRRRASRL
jgi:2-octaprenyl-6-methoxyphenol hydroxylase